MATRYTTSDILDMARRAIDKIVQNELGQIDYMQAEISGNFNRGGYGIGNAGNRPHTESSVVIRFGGESRTFSIRFVPLDEEQKKMIPDNIIPMGEADFYKTGAFERNAQNAVNVYVEDLRGDLIRAFLCQMKEKRGA